MQKTPGKVTDSDWPEARATTALTHTDAWKYANHNNIAIEPQLILCDGELKIRHLPDIHNNKGINKKGSVKIQTRKLKKKKKKKTDLERIWTLVFCTACFLFFTKWSLIVLL